MAQDVIDFKVLFFTASAIVQRRDLFSQHDMLPVENTVQQMRTIWIRNSCGGFRYPSCAHTPAGEVKLRIIA